MQLTFPYCNFNNNNTNIIVERTKTIKKITRWKKNEKRRNVFLELQSKNRNVTAFPNSNVRTRYSRSFYPRERITHTEDGGMEYLQLKEMALHIFFLKTSNSFESTNTRESNAAGKLLASICRIRSFYKTEIEPRLRNSRVAINNHSPYCLIRDIKSRVIHSRPARGC